MAGYRMQPTNSPLKMNSPFKMKRALPTDAAGAEPAVKKRKVHHQLHHKQPHAAEFSDLIDDRRGNNGGLVQQQLLRAISLELRAVGFDSATQVAMESLRAKTEDYMMNFLANVQRSMAVARRTEPTPNDFIQAMASRGLTSSMLEQHLDTHPFLPSQLLPEIPPPPPMEPPPPDIDDLLGPELSGKPVKESKKWIPKHLPAFPSKHTWQATPVYTERESDPRKIREKATEEGILAEQALRKLMAASKAGVEKQGAMKRRQSKRRKLNEELWQAAMKAVQEEEAKEEQRQEEARLEALNQEEFDFGFGFDSPPRQRQPPPIIKAKEKRKDESTSAMHVNYERKYWRKAAQGGNWAF